MVVELTTLDEPSDFASHAPEASSWAWQAGNSQHKKTLDSQVIEKQHSPACPYEQRLLPASERDEICFWFDLSENFTPSLPASSGGGGANSNRTFEFVAPNSSVLRKSRKRSQGRAERLVEAELHVFKLFPRPRRLVSLSARARNLSSGRSGTAPPQIARMTIASSTHTHTHTRAHTPELTDY